MNTTNGIYFLLLLLAGIFSLAFFVFKPFLYALILAVVLRLSLRHSTKRC